MVLALAFVGAARAADQPKPLAELAKDLRDSDREKRLIAVEAIRDHHKDKVLDVLPQLIETLGDELNLTSTERSGGRAYLLTQTIWATADLAGPERMKVIRESVRHENPKVRAAAYRLWLCGAYDKATKIEPDEILAAARKGLKDESPLVRSQAIGLLNAFVDRHPFAATPAFRNASPKQVEAILALLIETLEDRVIPRKGVANLHYLNQVPSAAEEAAVVLQCFQARAKPAIPALAKAAALGDEDIHVVGASCRALNAIAAADPDAAEEIVKLFRPLITDKTRSNRLRGSAVYAVNKIGPAARWVASDLADILEEPGANAYFRSVAYTSLANMGSRAAPAVPTLIRLLERATNLRKQQQNVPAHRALGSSAVWLKDWDWYVHTVDSLRHNNTPPGERGHVPFAFDYWMTDTIAREQWGILRLFETIGPAAALAVDPIERWLKGIEDDELHRKAFSALRAINK
jgi:hypothetical protein